MNPNLVTTSEIGRPFEPSPGWKKHLYWILVLGLVVLTWSVSPTGGPYVAALCNAVVGISLIAMSARSPKEDGLSLIYLGLLPLARMMGIIFSPPLQLVGLGSSGSDLWLAFGVLVVSFSAWTVNRNPAGFRWPRWETVLIIAISGVLVYLFGPRLDAAPSVSIPTALVVVISGFAVEWVLRGPMFTSMSQHIGAAWTVALTALAWFAIAKHLTYVSMAFIFAIGVLYGVAKWRGESTFWIGFSHALLNVLVLLPSHPLGGA